MNRRKPFTLLAAVIFLLMALVHLYRVASAHFVVVIGSYHISETVSMVAILVAGLLALMLFRESRS
jgi:preprotein translocase subunit SecY